ncbi:MAG: M14 family zinc carboxypeptidase [Verrucomicrobiae bacterium]|nr:M14 family zinc carboxypeptidase [Verrucomicrobiae bacterium]
MRRAAWQRLAIWVQARQHAWEAGSSWVGRGFIEWAAGDDPAAAQLRRAATIHFIPIMDVDNVAAGHGGKEAFPHDHNRDWTDQPIYPEVAAAQQRIRELHAQGRFHLYLDLHCPGAESRRPYFYGPFDLNQMGPLPKRNYDRFLALAADCIRDPMPLDAKYHFATYVKAEEERRRMSRGWVSAHTAEHVVALCLETAWNTPHSTPTGYQAVGRGLARAVARYFSEDPQRPASSER